MSNAELMDRFIAISYLYLVLKDPEQKDIPLYELAEYLDALDRANVPCSCPDQHIA
jgi:hypothetical protein